MPLPDSYYVALCLSVLLILAALLNRRATWAFPFGAVTATIAAWYLVEPLYFPELFRFYRSEDIQAAYDSVSIFYASLLLMTPYIAKMLKPRGYGSNPGAISISPDRILAFVALAWLTLLAFGTWRMEGDILGALFPVGARSGARMWSRAAGAGAGATGFIVSMAAYFYVLCLATFGVLLFFVKKPRSRLILFILILISWPYAFLQGSRNIALATVVPAGLAFLLFSRASLPAKFFVTVGGFLALEFAMRLVIAFRNTGFAEFDPFALEQTSHLGLNMASELVYIHEFISKGTLELSYGMRYLAELANVIPRAIWPGKPLIGIDYAVARGFFDASSDIGVFATISTGVIGQGVLNFGAIVGPVTAAALLAIWVGVLARFRAQATPLRLALFLVGLGLTFNLGRDITLLVLWPMVFGYLGVRLLEHRETRRRLRQAHSERRSRPTSATATL